MLKLFSYVLLNFFLGMLLNEFFKSKFMNVILKKLMLKQVKMVENQGLEFRLKFWLMF